MEQSHARPPHAPANVLAKHAQISCRTLTPRGAPDILAALDTGRRRVVGSHRRVSVQEGGPASATRRTGFLHCATVRQPRARPRPRLPAPRQPRRPQVFLLQTQPSPRLPAPRQLRPPPVRPLQTRPRLAGPAVTSGPALPVNPARCFDSQSCAESVGSQRSWVSALACWRVSWPLPSLRHPKASRTNWPLGLREGGAAGTVGDRTSISLW